MFSPISHTVGERLRAVREQLVWTQQELAERAGMQDLTIIRLESGRQLPDTSTVKRLAVTLGVRPRWLQHGAPPQWMGEEHTA